MGGGSGTSAVCPSVAWREGGGHAGEKAQQDKGDTWKPVRCVGDSNSTWLGVCQGLEVGGSGRGGEGQTVEALDARPGLSVAGAGLLGYVCETRPRFVAWMH